MESSKVQSQSTAVTTQDGSNLRRRAEDRLQTETVRMQPPRTEEATRRLVHELEVHKIELESQNAELRQARNELEAFLEKYAELYDFAPVGYFTLDCDGIIRTTNLAGASLLGIERSRLLGRRFGLFVAVEARLFFAEFLEKVFASQNKKSCEAALQKDEKHSLFVQIEAKAAASGQECHVAVIDISQRRQLEEQLKTLYNDLETRAAELEAANIDLEAFNFTVSHDLRGPLTTINSYCQILELGNNIDEEGLGYIREMYEGTLRMNQLIDTLLDFSRVTHMELHRQQVDLSKMANMVALELKVSEHERPVTFEIAERIVAHGDPVLLRVVLDNLFGNAWKYAGKQEGAVIEFGSIKVKGIPAFFVRDNGPGFDMANADKLFVPFQRLPGTSVEGSGIGLATVERIVSRHGGRVWAESAPGKGACFYFTLASDSASSRV